MHDINLSPRQLLAFTGVILVCGAIAFAGQRQAKMAALFEADGEPWPLNTRIFREWFNAELTPAEAFALYSTSNL